MTILIVFVVALLFFLAFAHGVWKAVRRDITALYGIRTPVELALRMRINGASSPQDKAYWERVHAIWMQVLP